MTKPTEQGAQRSGRRASRKKPGLLEFEAYHEPLVPLRTFYFRMLRSALATGTLIGISLGIGTVGYHVISHLPWLDAMLNASMILTGMGPVDRMETAAAKWFASGYAIFSGVAFLSAVGVFMAPAAHRLLHRFHLPDDRTDSNV
jgi:hypothetical protein